MKPLSFLALLVIAVCLAAPVLAAPTLYYTLNTTSISGTTAIDSAGVKNATLSGTYSTGTAGKVGEAVTFTTGTAVIGNPTELQSNSLTWAAWIKPASIGASRWAFYGGTSGADDLEILQFANGTLRCISRTSAGRYVVASNTQVSAGNWYRVVCSHNSATNQLQIYVNGVNEASKTTSGGAQSPTPARTLQFGSYDASTSHYAGVVDEVGFWNYALSGAEITTDYNGGAGYNYYQSAPPAPELTISAANIVTGSAITGLCVGTSGAATGTHCNNTGTTVTLNTTGVYNLTLYNISGGTYYNQTFQNYNFSATASLQANTTQGYLAINATRLYLNSSIAGFNASNGQVANTTTSGTLLLPANLGAQTVTVNVTGNGSKSVSCTLAAVLTTSTCTASGFYDDSYTLGAAYQGAGVMSFTATATNDTLGVSLSQSTTNGSVTFPLLQGYYYYFVMNTGVHSLENETLAANSTAQTYNFTVYTTNTFDINFKNESTNTAASGNVTVELISDAYAGNYTTTNGSLTVSLLTPGSYTIRYWREASVPREYYTTLEPQSYNTITLYLLDSDVSNIYIPKVVDQSGKRKANATVQLMRYYVDCNCYRTVEMAKTDTNGNAVMRVVPNVVPYKLLISSGGYSITTQPTKFTDQTNTYTLNLLSNPLESIQALPSISRSLSYNNATYTYTYTWTDTSGLVIQGCLNVQKFSRGRQTTAHSSCSSGASGSIIYTINDTNQTSYTATGSVQTSTQYSYYYDQSQISFTTTGASVFGLVGMLIFMILLLVMISIGAETGTDTIIIMTLIGTIGLGAFGIITASWSVLVPIIIVGAFAVYKTRT